MRTAPWALGMGLCLAAALGCSGEDGSAAGGGAGGAAAASTTIGAGAGGPGSGGSGAGSGCAEGLSSTTVPVDQGSISADALYAAARPDGGTVIAWSDGGSLWLTELDAQGNRVGPDRQVGGVGAHGLVAAADHVALLVARGSDELAFIKLDAGGQTVADVLLVGQSDHDTVGSEWYDYQPSFAADGGRLHPTADGYAAYFPIFRRWPDMIAHTGDTLRLLDENGGALGGGWDWGCSHSLDVRLSTSGSTLAPVCLSDCYSEKAILFENDTVISDEPSGNCGGLSEARLGGLVAAGDGFWLSYASREGRSSRDIAVVQVGLDGAPGAPVWLTEDVADDVAPHLAPLGQGLLVGWRSEADHFLAHLDGAGALLGAPKTIDGAFGEHDDFFLYPGGDVGWVAGSGSELVVYRYGACTLP